MISALFRELLYIGICLYAPTVALSSVTPLDSDTYLIVLGIICTIYSAIVSKTVKNIYYEKKMYWFNKIYFIIKWFNNEYFFMIFRHFFTNKKKP